MTPFADADTSTQLSTGARATSEVGTAADDLDVESFKSAFRGHPGGVAVITADAGDGPVALTATSVFSVSAEPPLLAFSVSEVSSSTPTILRAETVVVHLLGSSQLPIAKLGSTSGIDRFADKTLWSTLPTGEVYFPSSQVWIRGAVVNKIDAGQATIVIVRALQAELTRSDDVEPLVYHNRTWHRLGRQSELD